MIKRRAEDSETQRTWNGRDDNQQQYFGRIPLNEKIVELSLTWRKTKDAKPSLVGRFNLNMPALAKEGFVRKIEGHYILRFQSNGGEIEISKGRQSPPLFLGILPKSYFTK